MEWYEIVGIVFIVAGIACGGLAVHLSNLLKQSGEVLTALGEALEDGTITKKEAVRILKEANDVKDAFAKLLFVIRKAT